MIWKKHQHLKELAKAILRGETAPPSDASARANLHLAK
jgi:hypothetical protein